MRELLLAAAGAQGKTYVEDVFSAYPYVGNGSTQTITNGVDLTKGGMVWIKDRSSATYGHELADSVRGSNLSLQTNGSYAENNYSGTAVSSFLSSGFSLGTRTNTNNSGDNFASWTFRRAPKFFDVVTWTGDGTSNRQIPHALGIAPGMVTVKRRDSTGSWITRHRSATGELYLEQAAVQAASFTQITAMSATTFSVSGNANINGATYVAYAWAHDPDTVNGIVQCGLITQTASGVQANLGWEPQYLLVRDVSVTASWFVLDTARGLSNSNYSTIFANSSAADSNTASGTFIPQATGFTLASGAFSVGDKLIYLAIRRGPMRTPTTGASVYNAIARSGTGVAAKITGAGFPPDVYLSGARNVSAVGFVAAWDRLRGAQNHLQTYQTSPEATSTDEVSSFDMDGFTTGTSTAAGFTNRSGTNNYVDWLFRRAPGFMDEVCDTGTGAAHTTPHNLTVAPELVIRKGRNVSPTTWEVWHSALAPTEKLVLNSSAAKVTDATAWNSTTPTATAFSVGTGANVNTSAATYVTYLWATCPGVSKVFSYIGNGGSQTIACGFAAGARFVLIKRTDAAGDWLVWDTARGIVAANDPHLSLNTSAAEVTTDDSIDPDASGFIVNQIAATNININGASYIFLAIA